MTSRLVAVALALLATVEVAPARAQDVSGLAFDLTITTGDSASGPTQTGRGWIYGRRSRLDLKGTAIRAQAFTGMPGQNTSLIVHDSSEAAVVAVVDHDSKKFMYPARMMGQLREMMAAMAGEAPRMTLAITNVQVDTLGDGHTVSGFATRRFRVSADISMSMEIMGESAQEEMRVESEIDVAPELAEFADPLRDTRGLKGLTAGLPFVDSSATAQLEKLMRVTPRGLALRQVDRISGTSLEGEEVQTSTTLLSNVRRATFPLSTFTIPEGYTELEMTLGSPVN